MHFEIYSSAGEYRWRLKAANGRIVAESGEGYGNRADCEHGIRLVREAAEAPVQDLTAGEGRSAAGRDDLSRALETAFKQGEG